jgi:hypothetical protein
VSQIPADTYAVEHTDGTVIYGNPAILTTPLPSACDFPIPSEAGQLEINRKMKKLITYWKTHWAQVKAQIKTGFSLWFNRVDFVLALLMLPLSILVPIANPIRRIRFKVSVMN